MGCVFSEAFLAPREWTPAPVASRVPQGWRGYPARTQMIVPIIEKEKYFSPWSPGFPPPPTPSVRGCPRNPEDCLSEAVKTVRLRASRFGEIVDLEAAGMNGAP